MGFGGNEDIGGNPVGYLENIAAAAAAPKQLTNNKIFIKKL